MEGLCRIGYPGNEAQIAYPGGAEQRWRSLWLTRGGWRRLARCPVCLPPLTRQAAYHLCTSSVEDAAKQMREEQLTFLVVRDVAPTGTPERVVGLINERSFLSFVRAIIPMAPRSR